MMLDTNILIDLREEDAEWFAWSARAVLLVPGACVVSAIVAGELAASGEPQSAIEQLFVSFGFGVEPLPMDAAVRAGAAHRAYRAAGGRREKLLGDFLIGGHAAAAGATLLTRDPRWYRRYFPDLTLITPETHPHG